jgi:hypoxanthine-DNA glycosylase
MITPMTRLIHPWEPVYDEHSKVLILGTFPSPKSREFGFYFGHPQNKFWKTLARVLEIDEPADTIEDRTRFMLDNHLALGDTVYACQIKGAADATIRDPEPFDFSALFKTADIAAVFTTGRKATDLFGTLYADSTGMDAIYLPSTSPANGIVQRKPQYYQAWAQIRDYL